MSLKGDGHGRRASIPPYPNTLLAISIPPPLSVTLSCMYSFTLSFHLTIGLPLLLGIKCLAMEFFDIQKLFFQEIPAQCELKVWYSKDYAERMGTRILAG